MNKFESINQLLCRFCDAKKGRIHNRAYNVDGLSLIKIRDILIKMGKIHQENIEDGFYFSTIRGGFLNMNTAYFLVRLKECTLNLACYSEEGMIKQHTSEGVINEFEKQIKAFIR